MIHYIIKRITIAIPSFVGLTVIVFLGVHLLPGDVILIRFAESGTDPDPSRIAAARHLLGIDRPFYTQYFSWASHALRGDLGQSLWSSQSVTGVIEKTFPVTAELAIFAMILAILTGIPLGIFSAVRQDTRSDYWLRSISVCGLAIPSFWLGVLMVVLPSLWFHWSPPIEYVPITVNPIVNLQQFILPAIALAAAPSAIMMRFTRSEMLEVLRQDYIRTAFAKGLMTRSVVLRHALKNALIPVITLAGIQLGYLMGGSVLIEQVFSLPGIGRDTLTATLFRDYTQLVGNIVVIGLVFIVANLAVDVVYGALDPKVRYG